MAQFNSFNVPTDREQENKVSNEAYLNDYRNRMPFHYVEKGNDSYYYWQYGSTMEIEITIEGEIAVEDTSEDVYPVENIKINNSSILDINRIANLGTMSLESLNDFYKKVEIHSLIYSEVTSKIEEIFSMLEALDGKIGEEEIRAKAKEAQIERALTVLTSHINSIPLIQNTVDTFIDDTRTALENLEDKLIGEGWING